MKYKRKMRIPWNVISLGASLLGNLLASKGTIRVSEATIRPGEGRIRAR